MLRFFIGLILTPSLAFAEASGPDFYKTNPFKPTHIYAQPNTQSHVIATFAKNTQSLKNLGCKARLTFTQWQKLSKEEQKEVQQNVWCEISYESTSGWVQQTSIHEGQTFFKPSYTCEKAFGTIENLICQNAQLMQMDWQMHNIYKQALKAAQNLDAGSKASTSTLKAMQRGWIKGRNECWKAANPLKCTQDSYKNRISKLQADWRLIPVHTTTHYNCPNNLEFTASFLQTLPIPSAIVEVGDKSESFILTRTASGSKYVGSFGKSIWIKGDEATLNWPPYSNNLECNSQPKTKRQY